MERYKFTIHSKLAKECNQKRTLKCIFILKKNEKDLLGNRIPKNFNTKINVMLLLNILLKKSHRRFANFIFAFARKVI